MQMIKYTYGIWKVEARLQNAGGDTRIALISALTGTGKDVIESRHTLVFDHMPVCDDAEESKAHTQNLFKRSH